ncbi:DUF3634 family protein [Luteolibacter yonseiensis]|uniref:DUF3634 family protein n=1 Tax=Luteolibacter yonseiensis TaxID=1144680 RepID=A0A934V8G9_9BACT|nr:DUF3634 family protein [Luteolibacter yonseiensis]MBK1814103.1 DUF3634 family protein [Luteolibacter yonseiensis]
MKFLLRIFAGTLIRIRNGSADCVKGKVMGWRLDAISELAADANLDAGEIWVNGNGTVGFSNDIPQELHQRIRNVMASD